MRNASHRPPIFGSGFKPTRTRLSAVIRKLAAAGRTLTAAALAVLAMAVFPAAARAQAAGGGVQSPFELGGSARALGMGGAAVAVTGEGDGFFENPAVLATLREHEILTFHSPLFQDTLYDSVGYVNPTGLHSGFGLSFARLGTTGILETIDNIQPVSTFSSEELQGALGFGFRFYDHLDFGATVKYLREQMAGYQGSGVGVDLGLLYHFSDDPVDFSRMGWRNITLGLSATNALQPQTKLFETADEPVQVFRPAFSYLYRPSPASRLWLAFEGELQENGGALFKAGVEYGWKDTLFGRAGFDGASPTAGAGLRFSGFEFDYAYNQRDLGSLQRFSLTYRFGPYTDPLQTQRIDLLKWVARGYSQTDDYDAAIRAWRNVLKELPGDEEAAKAVQDLQRRRKNAIEDQLRMARSAIRRGDNQTALPRLARVMGLDPSNAEARDLLRQVDRKTLISTNYTKGVEAYSKQDYASAVEYLKMVYEVDPHYRDVGFLYHDAQSRYQPLESMPKDLTELYAQGVNYYMNGDYRKAVEVWEKVRERNPKNFLVQRNIDEARSRMNEKPEPISGEPVRQEH